MKLQTASRRGYTLIELLVVLLIIMLLTAAMIPVVLPAIQQNEIRSAANLVYGELTRAHDQAVRDNRPGGIRLIPDAIDPTRPQVVTASRLIAIEIGPDYSEGLVRPRLFDPPGGFPNPTPPGLPDPTLFANNVAYPYLTVLEDKWENVGSPGNPILVPRTPTSWFFNLRQGDRITLGDQGKSYTVAGPITNPTISYRPGGSVADPNGVVANYRNPAPNPERLINYGPDSLYDTSSPGTRTFEFLYLMDGVDNDEDGFQDEGFDGVDNDGDGIVDPGFNGLDDNGDGHIDEWYEVYLHRNADGSLIYPGCPDTNMPGAALPPAYANEYEPEQGPRRLPASGYMSYSVSRRPVVSRGARELALPGQTVVDLTSWNLTRERSRLPIDPYSGVVDIVIAPNGQLVAQGANANPAPSQSLPFYHIWLGEREDLFNPSQPPNPPPNNPGRQNWLPMPREAIVQNVDYYPADLPTLKASQRLISVNARTGQISTTANLQFDPLDLELPYRNAQQGIKEQP